MINDWKYQVLHKERIKVEDEQQEKLLAAEERRRILEDIEQKKKEEHSQLQQNILNRLAEQQEQERRKQQEKLQVEQSHISENKESYQIQRDIAEEREFNLNKKTQSKDFLKDRLLRQIEANKEKKGKMLLVKKEKEYTERKRLEHLSVAEKYEEKHQKNLNNANIEQFKEVDSSYRKIQKEMAKESKFNYLDEGWRIEKDKILEWNNREEKQKLANVSCAEFNKMKLKDIEEGNRKDEMLKQAEMRERLVWEDNLRKDVENVKCVKRDKQAKYLEELNHQKMSIDKYRLARENYNKDHLENIRKYQKHLEDIDLKEVQNPIDKKNPFQYY